LNGNPRYCVVPILELAPGSHGIVHRVDIFPDGSYIHQGPGRRIVNLGAGFNKNDGLEEFPRRLADHSDAMLGRLASQFSLSMAELLELRDIEREYRNHRRSAQPAER